MKLYQVDGLNVCDFNICVRGRDTNIQCIPCDLLNFDEHTNFKNSRMCIYSSGEYQIKKASFDIFISQPINSNWKLGYFYDYIVNFGQRIKRRLLIMNLLVE